jgi:hypothetical protein
LMFEFVIVLVLGVVSTPMEDIRYDVWTTSNCGEGHLWPSMIPSKLWSCTIFWLLNVWHIVQSFLASVHSDKSSGFQTSMIGVDQFFSHTVKDKKFNRMLN